MKQVCITNVPVGTHFFYKEEEYVVKERDEYPFILTKCTSNPDKYDGLDLMFANFEKVEVADDTKVYIDSFVNVGGNLIVRKETLEE